MAYPVNDDDGARVRIGDGLRVIKLRRDRRR